MIRKHDAAELIATRKKLRVSQRAFSTCEISSVTRLENTPGNGAACDEGTYKNTRTREGKREITNEGRRGERRAERGEERRRQERGKGRQERGESKEERGERRE